MLFRSVAVYKHNGFTWRADSPDEYRGAQSIDSDPAGFDAGTHRAVVPVAPHERTANQISAMITSHIATESGNA